MVRAGFPGRMGPPNRRSEFDPNAAAYNHTVILLAGQSNDVGTKSFSPFYTYDPVNDPTDPRILQWSIDGQGDPSKADKLTLGKDPLLHPGTFNNTRAVGPGMPMARALLQTMAANERIVLVPIGVGGTGLISDYWGAPSGTGYLNGVTALTEALAGIPNVVKVIVGWWQAENDMFYDRSAADYKVAFDAVIAGWRAIPGVENAPVIMGGVVQEYFSNDSVKRAIQYALADSPLRIDNCYYVPPPTGSATPSDSWHALTSAQRLIGGYWAAALDLASYYTLNVPATPSGVLLEGEVISWTENGAPAYVVQSRAAGSGDPWTDTIVYPDKYGASITHFCVIPGGGDREARVLARSRAGDSTPSSTLTYNVPVTAAPTWYWDLDFDGSPVDGSNIYTSMTSLGTDATAWAVGNSPARIDVNGKGACNITGTTQFFKRSTRIPAGSYTVLAAYYHRMDSNTTPITAVGELVSNNFIDVTINVRSISDAFLGAVRAIHNNDSALVTTPSLAIRGLGYVCIAFVYDSTQSTNNLKIYVNGALYTTGTVNARIRVAPSTKAFNQLNDSRTDAMVGTKLAFKVASSALSQADIVKAVHDIKTAYGIEWVT